MHTLTKQEFQILSYIQESEEKTHKQCTCIDVLNAFSPEKCVNQTNRLIILLASEGMIHSSGPLPADMLSKLSVSDCGMIAMNNYRQLKRNKLIENIRYGITTSIAIAAFVKSFFF